MVRNRIAAGLFIATIISVAGADIVMTTKRHTDSFKIMGQTIPASDRTTTTWIGTAAARLDESADTSIIMDLTTNTVRILHHQSRTYAEMQIPDMDAMVGDAMKQSGASAEEQAAAQQMLQGMMASMKFSVSVTPGSETRKIKTWNCQKYTVKTQIANTSSESEMWVTTDIRMDPALFQRVLNSRLLQMAGAADAMKEWTRIKGVPVLTQSRATVMGTVVANTDEVLSAEEKPAPAGTYTVPSGYKKVAR